MSQIELEFPTWAGVVAHAVVRAARRLALESADAGQQRPGAIPYEVLIRRTELVWRFYLAQKDDRVVLFFFRDIGDETTVLRAEVRFTIAATARVALGVSDLRDPPARWEAVIPRFVWLDPDALSVHRYAGTDADPVDTTLLRLHDDGTAVLAVVGEEDDATLIYTTPRHRLTLDEDAPWEPFVLLLRLVRDWVESRGRTGTVEPGVIPRGGPSGMLGDVLRAMLSGHAAAARRLAAAARSNTESDLRLTEYAVSTFRGEVVVRLDAEGRLSTSDQDGRQVSVAVDVRPVDDGIAACVTMAPADFLVRDALHDAIVVEVGRAIEKWRTRVFDDDVPTAEQLAGTLHSPDTRTFTCRVDRSIDDSRTIDTNVVVWERSGSAPRLLVARATLDVVTDTSPPTATVGEASDVEILLFGDPANPNTPVPDVIRGYAARFVADLRRGLQALR